MSKRLTILAFAVAVSGAALPFAMLGLVKAKGVDVRLLTKLDDAVLGLNKLGYRDGDDPAKLYGGPTEAEGESRTLVTLVFYDKAGLVSPAAGPAKGRHYYILHGNERPVQAQSLIAYGRYGTGAMLLGAGMLFFLASCCSGSRSEHRI